jgi:hypothetical protein
MLEHVDDFQIILTGEFPLADPAQDFRRLVEPAGWIP